MAFKISVRPYKSALRPHLKWVLTVRRPTGQRERFFFKTKPEAESQSQIKRMETERIGVRALNISDSLRLEALDAHEKLSPFGVSITQVVAEYVQKRLVQSARIDDLVQTFIDSRIKVGRSKRHVACLGGVFKRFVSAFSGQMVANITAEAIEDWLDSLNVKPISINSYRTLLHSLFAYAVKRRLSPENPIAFIERRTVKDSKVGILSPTDVYTLLTTSADDVRATFALGAFAGIRPEEILRMTWEEIDMQQGLIDIPSTKSKTAKQRYVKILPILKEWLQPLFGKGLIQQPNFRRRFDATREKAGFCTRESDGILWPHDGLRHSFASYHLAKFQDAAALALQLGHETTSLIFSNYRYRVKPSDAELYFSLFPGTELPPPTPSEKQIPPQASGDLFLKKKTPLPQAGESDRIRGEGNSGANEASGRTTLRCKILKPSGSSFNPKCFPANPLRKSKNNKKGKV